MARCAASRRDGAPCKVEALADSPYCYAHDPSRAGARQAAARKGGKTAGQGRPAAQGELTEIRQLLRSLTGKVYTGDVAPAIVYAMNALCNSRLRIIELERKLKETEELEQRLAALEATAPPQGGHRWG